MKHAFPRDDFKPEADRLKSLVTMADQLAEGRYDVRVPAGGVGDDIDRLAGSMDRLARAVDQRFEEMQRLAQLTEQINAGLLLDEVLDYVYEQFRTVIPYNRIGFSLLEDRNRVLRARWARTDAPRVYIKRGYSASMAGSSLQRVLDTGEPRILNDLEDYLRKHPSSDSTRLIVEEGMRSSLTCPLIAMKKPVGFMFFSSIQVGTYRDVHVDFFQRIARQLSVILEKSRLYQELLELNELKNRFLGMAAHDLPNPLAVISGYQQLLMDEAAGGLSAEQRASLGIIGQATRDMLNMVDTLLDVSAIEAGRLVIKAEVVNLRSFLEQRRINGMLLSNRKHIDFTVAGPDGVSVWRFDPYRISQVIENLLSNAFKFSMPGTAVELAVRGGPEFLELVVTDHGPGIPDAEMDRVFCAYCTTSVKPTGGESSTGLGLAICRRIVEAHGGTISVRSKVGEGSVFTVLLPP
ncbi:MAG TPA: ATP-binding protein [Kiritimatiellia bacterium]|nr:ATP-binding protein [Kiritimatiellia bacterium]HMP32957.1 ATP-binding protein [Kiritimatiellia bacterium]